MSAPRGPLAGITVVEVAAGVSDLGIGLAGAAPGMILAGLGAEVTRVVGTHQPEIDEHLSWTSVWHRGKRLVVTDDAEEVGSLVAGADVALLYGPEETVEGRGLGWVAMHDRNPRLVHLRCRPSRTGRGVVDHGYGLLVEAAAGFCTQLDGHRPGPIFVDVRAACSGAGFLLTTSALALLRQRAITGEGGWAETSLYDGLLATLGCMIGRSEHAAPPIEGYWQKGSTFPNFLFRCADGELVQVWFGGKGMYEALIGVLGDEPSVDGYYADQMRGVLGERKERWHATFATRRRDEWVAMLREAGVACEPVLAPGEVLFDPHVVAAGLTVAGEGDVLVVASPVSVAPMPSSVPSSGSVVAPPPERANPLVAHGRSGGLLAGVKVLDFSAFVAGPLSAQVLADLGAEVIKVEPPAGEAMRAAAYAVAACQRGKRSLAIDLGAPEAHPVIARLLAWADVVLHNFRVGVAERLGIGAADVAAANPRAVYCHASAFGVRGPRAAMPGNDALMQAVTGFEHAVGGAGNDPIAATWIPIDMTGGWLAAAGMLAGLVGVAGTGEGQQVTTSLLGAGLLLHSGVYRKGDELERGPRLDAAQTGYGPGYRIYRAADQRWFALVLPDAAAWRRLGTVPGITGLPEAYTPLRVGELAERAAAAERVLEAAFATEPAATWLARCRQHGLLAEAVEELDRDGFRSAILDDPINRQLGRAVTYDAFDWGRFEQNGPLLRCGPQASTDARLELPAVGQHSVEVLTDLGFGEEEIAALVAASVVRVGRAG